MPEFESPFVRTTKKTQVSLTWPKITNERLDELVTLAYGAGAKTTRRELAAAVFATSEPDSDHLSALLDNPFSPDSQVTLEMPIVVSDRLSVLARLAIRSGVRSSRSRISSGLILGTDENSDKLAETLLRYRRAKVEDIKIPD